MWMISDFFGGYFQTPVRKEPWTAIKSTRARSQNAYVVMRRTDYCFPLNGPGGITVKIKEIHMKIIALGLLPVFLILAIILPNTTGKIILLGGIMVTAFVVSYIGMSMEKKGEKEPDDLLAIPPKKS
jgi:hypothetical protein